MEHLIARRNHAPPPVTFDMDTLDSLANWLDAELGHQSRGGTLSGGQCVIVYYLAPPSAIEPAAAALATRLGALFGLDAEGAYTRVWLPVTQTQVDAFRSAKERQAATTEPVADRLAERFALVARDAVM